MVRQIDTRPLDHTIMDRTRVNEASYLLQVNRFRVTYLSHRAMHREHFF
jgi:hypothetical protein